MFVVCLLFTCTNINVYGFFACVTGPHIHVLRSSSHFLPCLSVHTVVLYSCPELAVDCSSCIGLNDNFNCAYCTTASGFCMLSALTCSPGSLVEPPNFDQCPIPMFDEVCTNEHDCLNACVYWVVIV